MVDKIIVSNGGALAAKYNKAGVASIRAALAALIASDKKRGITTTIVHLDDAATMKKFGAPPVSRVNDYRANKVAIDAVFKKLKPDYIMILGSTDVVPHQDLANPVFKAGEDDDPVAWGDLPYACDTPYARDPAKFVGPTRVVGRLPDLTAATEPSHLLSLLKTCTDYTCRSASEYAGYFGLSTFVWQGSTKLSLESIFGNSKSLNVSPKKGPNFPAAVIRSRMHFINCHGDNASPEFYGQKGKRDFPVSLSSKSTQGKIREGTVASIECCFGAQLYDAQTLALDIPICQSYLRQGAYGYFGSTTIAYGPADENGAADLLCQFFLINVLSGASIGRAALAARQKFVETASQMDPIDLKTLAQFCLHGDPGVHPVDVEHATKIPRGTNPDDTARFRRKERRTKLKQVGDFLQDTKPTASKVQPKGTPPAKAKAALRNIAERSGLADAGPFVAFKVEGIKRARGNGTKLASAPSRYYLKVGTPKANEKQKAGRRVAVIAKEVGGRIIDYRVYYER
jgi:hypothetical protein